MDTEKLTVGDVLEGLHKTREALKRCDDLIRKVTEKGTAAPKALGLMAESTTRFRERLLVEVEELERAYEEKLNA